MATEFTVGDVIRKTRKKRLWSQTRLGLEAAKVPLVKGQTKIDKSTVSKVENAPYSSEFGTVWRLISALGLTLADVEMSVGGTRDLPARRLPADRLVGV